MKLFAQVTKPENGYRGDKEDSYALIEANGAEYLYEVESVAIGRSSTDVHLKGLPNGRNSVNFSFFVSENGKQVREYDVFENKLNLSQIHHTYINMLSR